VVSYDEVPVILCQAVLAAEDKNFSPRENGAVRNDRER
jgi:membrane peptidoglycan carboxypeptidase